MKIWEDLSIIEEAQISDITNKKCITTYDTRIFQMREYFEQFFHQQIKKHSQN